MQDKDIEIKKATLEDYTLENTIIAKLIEEPTEIDKCKLQDLKETHFSQDIHSKIYKAMLDLSNKEKEINLITIAEEIERVHNIASVTVAQTVTEITSNAISIGNIRTYAQKIRDLHKKREIKELLESVISYLPSKSMGEITQDLELSTLYADSGASIDNLFCNIDLIDYNKETEAINTGFTCIDNVTKGLQMGTLTLISGDSGVGKSTLINQIIANAIFNNYKAFIYSGELPDKTVGKWLARSITRAEDLEKVERITASGDKIIENVPTKKALHNIQESIKDKVFIYNNKRSKDIDSLEYAISKAYKVKGAKLILIDNLMTVSCKGAKTDLERQQIIASRLKDIAIKHNIAVILVLHNRKNKEKDSGFYNIAGASEVVNLADIIINIKLDLELDGGEGDNRLLDIQKNRTTGVRTSNNPLYFNRERKRYFELGKPMKEYDYNPRQIKMTKGATSNE